MQLARGRHWEAVAAEYLEDRGLVVLARGYRCRLGEIDLVCRDQHTLVMVEVRARSLGALARAAESIGPAKRARIIRATNFLMRRSEWRDAPTRRRARVIDTAEARVSWLRTHSMPAEEATA
jgi:putative endonuclease